MVDRVDLLDEIGDVELQLDQLQIGRQVARAETFLVGQVGRISAVWPMHHIAIDEVGRREGADAFARVHVLDQRVGVLLARHVLVFELGRLHEQADELAAAGDRAASTTAR